MFSLPESLLLTLAGIGDLIDSIPTQRDWYHLNYIFKGKGHPRNYYQAMHRLLTTGQIEKEVTNGKVVLRITPSGLTRLKKTYPLEKLRREKWNGLWRQVIFDIEEKHKKDREFARRKLKELGFGMLQESVWISPFPIEREIDEFFSSQHLRGELIVLNSSIYSGDEKQLANRAFKLDVLNESYEDLADEWEKIMAASPKNEAKVKKWQTKYYDLLLKDPFLPKELLPQPWFGTTAAKIHREKTARPAWRKFFSVSKH